MLVNNIYCLLRGVSLLAWEQEDVDVWQDSSVGDGGVAHQLVQLFVVSDGELDVSWHNSGLVVSGGVTGELQNLSCEVFEDGGHVDWGTGSNSLGVSALLQESGDSSDWELKSCLSGS